MAKGFSRQDRLGPQLTKLIADFIAMHSSIGILVSVTHATVGSDLANATAFVTIFPEDKESDVLGNLRSQENKLKKYLAEHTRLKRVPSIRFEIDAGEKNRRRIEELTKKQAC